MNVELLSDTIPTPTHEVVGFGVFQSHFDLLEQIEANHFRLRTYNFREKIVSELRPASKLIWFRRLGSIFLDLYIDTGDQFNNYMTQQFYPIPQSAHRQYEKLASNLIAQPFSASFKLFDLQNTKFYDYTPRVAESPPFVSFLSDEYYVYIDSNCENVNFWSLAGRCAAGQKRIKRAAGLRMPTAKKAISYVFKKVVIIACEKRIFRLDRRTFALHEITEHLNLGNCSLDAVNLADDGDALYVHDNPRLYKIQITGIDWSFLDDSWEKAALAGVTCPVCLDHYRNPKVLSKCGHSICESCEEGLRGSNYAVGLACPVCRLVTQLSGNERLPVNWLVDDLLKIIENIPETILCHSCSTSIPLNQALECSKCAKEQNLTSVILCGPCAVKGHRAHISDVETAVFSVLSAYN